MEPQRRRRLAPPSLVGDEVPSYPPSPRKGYCSGLHCTCDSDGEERPHTPIGGYDTPIGGYDTPPPQQGQGYKHYQPHALRHRSLIASLKRARKRKQREAILINAPNSFFRYLSNLTHRLVSGKVRISPSQRKRLLPYGQKLLHLAKVKDIHQLRRQVVSQKGGILPIIPFLLGLGPLLAKGLAVGAATAAGSLAVKKALGNGSSVPQTGSGAYGRKRYYYYE